MMRYHFRPLAADVLPDVKKLNIPVIHKQRNLHVSLSARSGQFGLTLWKDILQRLLPAIDAVQQTILWLRITSASSVPASSPRAICSSPPNCNGL